MEKGKLIIVSGPSGVGKNNIIERFINDPELNLAQVISMTSRTRRESERDGIHYDFVTREYFEEAIKNGKLLEYTEFLGNYYGTPIDSVERLRDLGKNVLLEVEPTGAKQIRKIFPNSASIFIVPSSLEGLEKMIRERRKEEEDVVSERLNKARSELNLISDYKFVVNNDDPELAGELCSLIIKRYITKAD